MTEKELILTSILKCRHIDLVLNKKELTLRQKKRFDDILRRRQNGEPLQYIIGDCDFMGINLSVDERVLIPRPETEILVDLAVKNIQSLSPTRQLRILDLGTGSGCIPIAIAKNIFNSRIVSIDISEDALNIARYNAKRNFVENRVDFLCRDMISFLNGEVSVRFDVIISNPPYIKTDALKDLPLDVKHEPVMALDGGSDGLKFYRSIIENADRLLNDGGFIFCELGDDQAALIEDLCEKKSCFKSIRFEKDYVGVDRIFIAQKY